MNKQKFINLLHDFDNIADHERNKLHELATIYPYSQIIHTLVAKANNDARTEIAGKTLNYAAMYATDRNVLKAIIQKPTNGSKIKPAVAPQQNNNTADKHGSDKLTVPRDAINLEADHLRKEVWLDLAALKKSKASYMAWAAEEEELIADNKTAAKAPINTNKAVAAKNSAPIIPKKGKVKKNAPKVKSEVKKGKVLKPKAPTAQESQKEDVKGSKTKKSAPHEEQKKLIDNFISKEPRLSARPLKVTENQPDLSESSTAFNEDLVSENLAQIFIDQGKKEKAIDIYKKLIWKFPQKKAYFASRIEELKN
ncbi:MAG: hypothetical protein WD555_00135 [Fulvivirga sp.]